MAGFAATGHCEDMELCETRSDLGGESELYILCSHAHQAPKGAGKSPRDGLSILNKVALALARLANAVQAG